MEVIFLMSFFKVKQKKSLIGCILTERDMKIERTSCMLTSFNNILMAFNQIMALWR